MLLLLFFAFLAGVVTILSPCILPILPIVLSGSLAGGHKRPLGIVTGFILSFTFFTLALSALVSATGLSADALRTVAVVIIFGFGLSLLLPQTQVLLEQLFTKLSGLTPQQQNDAGFFGGIVVGLSLGLVWAPCVGPILASVITLAVTSKVTFAAVLITLAYSIGSAVPMLLITYGGRQLLQKLPWLLKNTAKIQKGFGVIMMITALGIAFNVDRQFQIFILQEFPQYGTGLTSLETNSTVTNALQEFRDQSGLQPSGQSPEATLMKSGTPAPDFVGGTNWINSAPLSLKGNLKGKVVLVDFWTFSCINCIRTMPYLRQWYASYKDKGFVIVGVHAPEFEFEKKDENVAKAAKDFQLTYPIVQDNNFAIWKAYKNEYWPAHYLIDKNGDVRYVHFGEGNYAQTENAIRSLLDEAPLSATAAAAEAMSEPKRQTPETYLGFAKAEGYTQENQIVPNQPTDYTAHSPLENDAAGLNGKWLVGSEHITTQSDGASLKLNFLASEVFLVAGSETGDVKTATVKLDGQPLPAKYYTDDMNEKGEIQIKENRKYDVINLGADYGRHEIEIIFSNGVAAYSFTFGS
jgi:cytochrome c biogenesis protein CcdA/thiol-disulfide isomerase/thioredoxin